VQPADGDRLRSRPSRDVDTIEIVRDAERLGMAPRGRRS
jgi:hypothetical protein